MPENQPEAAGYPAKKAHINRDISSEGLDFIMRWESLRLKAYKPTPDDVWTIGFGHTKNVYQGMECTPVEVAQWLHDDLIVPMQTVNGHVYVPLTQPQFDALCSLVFNVGAHAFLLSQARFALNDGDIPEFLKQAFSPEHGFTRQGGRILPGLVNRRAAEQRLFTDGVYR